jgi:hypothetical protein
LNKPQIIASLISAHKSFWEEAKDLSPEAFHQSSNGKWSAAQNIEHINKGLRPTVKYFSLPKEEIETRFGLSNHPSGSSNEMLSLYATELTKGWKAPERMIPGNTEDSFEALTAAGNASLQTLTEHLKNWNEEELDKYNCPHIVLGNITPREMLYFIISHVKHHHKAIIKIKQAV